VHRRHVDIYLDESGDLGLTNPLSSKHLVILALITTDSETLARIAKRARRRFYAINAPAFEFKFNIESDLARGYILQNLSRTESTIVWGALDKKRFAQFSMARGDDMYAWLCRKVLQRTLELVDSRTVHLTVDDRCRKRRQRQDFDEEALEIVECHYGGYFVPSVLITHMNSINSPGIQIADFAVGAVFQKIERNNDVYFRIIDGMIARGEIYPKKQMQPPGGLF
jgi:hypothetical protein